MALGLNADDVMAVDSFIEELKEKKTEVHSTFAIKSMAEKDALKLKVGIVWSYFVTLTFVWPEWSFLGYLSEFVTTAIYSIFCTTYP